MSWTGDGRDLHGIQPLFEKTMVASFRRLRKVRSARKTGSGSGFVPFSSHSLSQEIFEGEFEVAISGKSLSSGRIESHPSSPFEEASPRGSQSASNGGSGANDTKVCGLSGEART